MAGFGIYIHWPYCLSKCPYCDFFSRVDKRVAQDDLIDGYLRELDFYAGLTGGREVTSVFFGGGTPSLLKPRNIERLITHIAEKWQLAQGAEISLEANPNSRTPTLFADLKAAGINRLSLGVQSLHDDDLRFLGRTHNAAEAKAALTEAVRVFDNHSADLMYALPQQDERIWAQDIDFICGLGLRHLSLYQLTIEEGTVFARKGIRAMEEERAGALFARTNHQLAANGYPAYEVSNYARPGFLCRHNLLYWQGDDYLGIGPAAHGRLCVSGRFYASTHCCQLEELTPEERGEELLLMGLRLYEGIHKARFAEICGFEPDDIIDEVRCRSLQQAGLLENGAEVLRVTPAGMPLLNHILRELAV